MKKASHMGGFFASRSINFKKQVVKNVLGVKQGNAVSIKDPDKQRSESPVVKRIGKTLFFSKTVRAENDVDRGFSQKRMVTPLADHAVMNFQFVFHKKSPSQAIYQYLNEEKSSWQEFSSCQNPQKKSALLSKLTKEAEDAAFSSENGSFFFVSGIKKSIGKEKGDDLHDGGKQRIK